MKKNIKIFVFFKKNFKWYKVYLRDRGYVVLERGRIC